MQYIYREKREDIELSQIPNILVDYGTLLEVPSLGELKIKTVLGKNCDYLV